MNTPGGTAQLSHSDLSEGSVQIANSHGRIEEQVGCFHTRARQREDNDETNVEPVHSYDAFHTRSDMSGVKGIIGMHRFNSCLVGVLLWCETLLSVRACRQVAPRPIIGGVARRVRVCASRERYSGIS